MLMFWNMYYRWILFIGGWVLIGVGSLLRGTGSSMPEKDEYGHLTGKSILPKGDMKPGGCFLTFIGILALIAWIASFVGVTF